jgi:hypothetical protein
MRRFVLSPPAASLAAAVVACPSSDEPNTTAGTCDVASVPPARASARRVIPMFNTAAACLARAARRRDGYACPRKMITHVRRRDRRRVPPASQSRDSACIAEHQPLSSAAPPPMVVSGSTRTLTHVTWTLNPMKRTDHQPAAAR